MMVDAKRQEKANATTRRRPRAVTEEDVTAASTAPASLTEVNASERLASHLKGRFCYCPALGWMQWHHKQRWREVAEDVVVEVARTKHKSWYARRLGLAVATKSGEVGPLRRLLSKSGVVAVVALCRGQLLVDGDAFDADPDLLNTPTGVVDLRTMTVRPATPGDYMTKMTTVGFVQGAKHADWKAVLKAVRPGARAYLQTRAGQGLTGHQPDDDVVLFLHGGGENGKSTFLGGYATALGTYYRQVSDKILLADAKSHSTELTDLRGLRVAAIEELPEGRHLNAILLKKITGLEITARRMRRDDMTFATTHSTFVTTNYRTNVAETDWGTWRRLQKLAFPYTYGSTGTERKSDERVGDPGLRDRVRTDPKVLEAALAWAIEGAAAWYANGKVMPEPPASVREDTDAWRAESDLVLKYWREFLEPDPDAYVPTTALREHFNAWQRQEGHAAWSAQTIASRFGGHDLFRKHHVVGPKQTKPKLGLSIPPGYDGEGGDGETVTKSTGFKAWIGLRYQEDE